MGRPPTHGAPSFRFHAAEVAQMETLLQEHSGQVPPRELLVALATQFSNSSERAGKSIVQMKQVWNWFQNRRYALRSKLVKPPGNPNMPPNPQGEVAVVRNIPPFPQQTPLPSGHNVVRNTSENPPMEFEAKSARDGAWYDVQAFISHRYTETGNPEVLVRFAGFGQEEDEWVNVRKHARQRSLPCESSECIVVLPGDLILCFQEGKEQALYFDAHVLDAQRRRHDVRGCRCRFLVRYDHDQSEEIVPLRKICRRPETDYRLQLLHSTNDSATTSSITADSNKPAIDPTATSTLRVSDSNPFPSHTIVNPTAGDPHPTVSPATASASALSTTPAPSLTPTLSWTSPSAPDQAMVQAQAPALAPALASVHTPSPVHVQGPTLAPAPASTAAPTQTPTIAPALAPGEAPAPSAAPTQAPAQAPALVPDEVPALASASSPALAFVPAPVATLASASFPTPPPSLTSMSAPTPTIPVCAPDPSLTPTQNLAPTPIMTSTPSLTPASAQSSSLFGAPEVKKIVSDSSAASSAGEASAQKSITDPSAASKIMEVKMEEISIPETSTQVAAGSSISQGKTSENPSVTTVFSPEKIESSIAPSEPMEVRIAQAEGGPSVSTVAESISVLNVSADHTKE